MARYREEEDDDDSEDEVDQDMLEKLRKSGLRSLEGNTDLSSKYTYKCPLCMSVVKPLNLFSLWNHAGTFSKREKEEHRAIAEYISKDLLACENKVQSVQAAIDNLTPEHTRKRTAPEPPPQGVQGPQQAAKVPRPPPPALLPPGADRPLEHRRYVRPPVFLLANLMEPVELQPGAPTDMGNPALRRAVDSFGPGIAERIVKMKMHYRHTGQGLVRATGVAFLEFDASEAALYALDALREQYEKERLGRREWEDRDEPRTSAEGGRRVFGWEATVEDMEALDPARSRVKWRVISGEERVREKEEARVRAAQAEARSREAEVKVEKWRVQMAAMEGQLKEREQQMAERERVLREDMSRQRAEMEKMHHSEVERLQEQMGAVQLQSQEHTEHVQAMYLQKQSEIQALHQQQMQSLQCKYDADMRKLMQDQTSQVRALQVRLEEKDGVEAALAQKLKQIKMLEKHSAQKEQLEAQIAEMRKAMEASQASELKAALELQEKDEDIEYKDNMVNTLVVQSREYQNMHTDCIKAEATHAAMLLSLVESKNIGELDEDTMRKAVERKFKLKAGALTRCGGAPNTKREEEAILFWKFKKTEMERRIRCKTCDCKDTDAECTHPRDDWMPLKTSGDKYIIDWQDPYLVQIEKELGKAVQRQLGEERLWMENLCASGNYNYRLPWDRKQDRPATPAQVVTQLTQRLLGVLVAHMSRAVDLPTNHQGVTWPTDMEDVKKAFQSLGELNACN